MKQVSQDVCRRTGITTETDSTIDLERASTLPLSSTTSVLLLSTSDNIDVEAATNQSSQDSSSPPPDVHARPAQEKLATERLRQLWSGPSSLPTPPGTPGPFVHEAQPFRPARSVLRRKSDPVKVPQTEFAEKLNRSSMCTDQKCLLETKCPSCCYADMGQTPEPHEYSRMSSLSPDPKGETKRMYENPLSSNRLGLLSPPPGDGGSYKAFSLRSEDQRDQQEQQEESTGYTVWDLGTAHQRELHVPGFRSKIPLPFQDLGYIGTQNNPVEQKDAPLQMFRNACDAAYKRSNATPTNDAIISGGHSTVSHTSKPLHGSNHQNHVMSMVDKVRQKVDSEGPPRKLLSPVSEENGALSSRCDVMKDPPSDDPRISPVRKLGRYSPFPERPSELKVKKGRLGVATGCYRGSSGNSGFGKIEITSDINRKKTLHHVAQESTISQVRKLKSLLYGLCFILIRCYSVHSA